MIIEPRPAIPTTRGGNARRRIFVALPVVLLVGAVGAALLGSQPKPVTALVVPTPSPASARPQSTSVPTQAPRPSASPTPAPLPEIAVVYPDRALGLATRSVAETLQGHHLDGIGRGLVAVRGWLSVRPDPSDCGVNAAGLVVTSLCQRATILSDSSRPTLGWQRAKVVPLGLAAAHLHPDVAPGVSLGSLDLPGRLAPSAQYPNGPVLPLPVVIVGRFSEAASIECVQLVRRCGSGFVVEQLAWAAGSWQDTPIVAALPGDVPISPRMARRVASATLRTSTVVLSQDLLSRAALAGVGRATGGAGLDVGDGADGPVWYLRVLLRRPVPPGGALDPEGDGWARSVGWVVIDAEDGLALASGTEG